MAFEKIIALLDAATEYQYQGIELLAGLNDPEMTAQIRTHYGWTGVFTYHRNLRRWRGYFNGYTLKGPQGEWKIDEAMMTALIDVGLLQNADIKHFYFVDADPSDLEMYLQRYPDIEVLQIKSSKNYFSSWGSTTLPLDELPEEIGTLKNLKRLYIENHYDLQTLPESMANLTQLEKVSFARTGLGVLPSWLMNCPNLTALNVNGMHNLKAIHPALLQKPSLQIIHSAQNAARGSLRPALPNHPVTIEKYTRMQSSQLPRIGSHEMRWRQEGYLAKQHGEFHNYPRNW